MTTPEEFRERLRQKVLAQDPTLEGEALENAIRDERARWIRQGNLNKQPDPFLTPNERPILAIAEELSAITDWVVIVEEFVRRNPLHYDRAGLWYAWNRKRKAWETIDEVDLLNAFDASSRKSTLTPSVKSQVVEALKRKARATEPKKAPATWVQFGDSIVDVQNGKTFEATAEYRLTSPVPWKIGKSIETPHIDGLLKSWAGEKEDAPDWRTLKSFIAYSALQDTPVHIFLFIYGSGSNGKSVFVRLLRKFLGSENVASTTLERLQTNRFETFSLRGKLVATVGETEVAVLERSGILKAITGGDSVPIEAKGKGSFSEVLTVKLIINGNSVPSTTDRTDGFYRRALVVDFPNKFEGDQDPLLDVPDEEFPNLARWVATVELPRIVRERTLTNQGSIEQRRQRYEARSDVLGQFLGEKTCSSKDGYLGAFDLSDAFRNYCKERGHRVMSAYELGQAMKDRGHEKVRKWISELSTTIWVYEGIKFKPQLSELSELTRVYTQSSTIGPNRNADSFDSSDSKGTQKGTFSIEGPLNKPKNSRDACRREVLACLKSSYPRPFKVSEDDFGPFTREVLGFLERAGWIVEVAPSEFVLQSAGADLL